MAAAERVDPGAVGPDALCEGFQALGLREGGVVMVHASLSAFGRVAGGAASVVSALLACIGPNGTLVVPAFTGEVVADPAPDTRGPEADAARARVPLFDEAMATAMGAVPNAVLAWPDRSRSRHPQASVAALGAHAGVVTARQPFGYALGADSPFAAMYALGAQILLLGVGHNRNSFLHHAESLIPGHRRKLRRFPWLVEGERVWIEAPDVGDDNGTYFPRVGAEFDAAGGIRHRGVGAADCRLMDSVPFIDFARTRLADLLADAAGGSEPGVAQAPSGSAVPA